MYNPFILLTPQILEAMLRQNMYFVRQYYPRGHSERDKPGTVPLLFSHYIHYPVELERSLKHFRVIKDDPYRFRYDTTVPGHIEKLRAASLQPEGFKIYTNLLPGKWTVPFSIRKKLDLYLAQHFEWWQNSRSQHLKIQLQDLYGELYLLLGWKGNKVEVLLDEVEMEQLHVL
jgi:hypothetical protein